MDRSIEESEMHPAGPANWATRCLNEAELLSFIEVDSVVRFS